MIDRVNQYDVIWDSPSSGPEGSMPVGNGDIGANVWVEAGGDLLLLIGKTDAWDENSINLKLGRIRVRFSPKLVVSGAGFCQRLRLGTGEIEIGAGEVRVRVWVDANQPVIRVEATGGVAMSAELECWRTEPRAIKTQTSDMFKNLAGKNGDPYPTIVGPDRILRNDERIVWCHHNERREPDAYEVNMKLQGLGEMIGVSPHPLLGRTFGAAVVAEAGGRGIAIHALTLRGVTIEQWQKKLEEQIAAAEAVDFGEARRRHEKWWEEFWNRSWIYIPAAFEVTRGYILQRFMVAASGRGADTGGIKHNGGLFTVGVAGDPDFRRWGGPGWWFQNLRLIYWPMLAAGDFDLILPWLKMYRESLSVQQARTKKYFGHGGAHYPETITFWGAEVSSHYGWTPFEQRRRPEAESAYLKYYWSGGIELVLMMCEYFSYTGDKDFARDVLMPVAEAVMEFFDVHYARDSAGKIRFSPGQALETWQEVVNPTPEIAGLRYTLPRLLGLPEELTSAGERARWRRMVGELPAIPVGKKEGREVVLPAEEFDLKKNVENPELYCVFPYRVFGVGKGLELGRATFEARLHRSDECWSQDSIQAALLGLTELCKAGVERRVAPAAHSDSRFPSFWNACHDWAPDMDHGGVLQMALQLMLVQAEETDVKFLAAWPVEWDVDFKLRLPGGGIAQGAVRGGQLVRSL